MCTRMCMIVIPLRMCKLYRRWLRSQMLTVNCIYRTAARFCYAGQMYDSYTSTVSQYRTYPLGFTHNRSCGSRSPPCQPHRGRTRAPRHNVSDVSYGYYAVPSCCCRGSRLPGHRTVGSAAPPCKAMSARRRSHGSACRPVKALGSNTGGRQASGHMLWLWLWF